MSINHATLQKPSRSSNVQVRAATIDDSHHPFAPAARMAGTGGVLIRRALPSIRYSGTETVGET